MQDYIDEHGALDAMDVVRIGIQIASGLAAAHEQGLVHRDIKPANILLENGINRVQITDFGLARAAHDVDLTRTGIIAGTPAFMSPEQSLSETIDFRSDLFSLGSVLYYAATGRLPFRASTPIGVLQQVCNGTPTRPRDENSQIPDRLESVIEKLLAKSPEHRFETASELRSWLTEYLAHLQQPTTTTPPRRLVTPSSRQRVRRIWRRLGIGIGLPVFGIIMASIVWPRQPNPPRELNARSAAESSVHEFNPGQIAAAVAAVASASEIDAEILAIELATTSVEQMNAGASISVDQFDVSVRGLLQELTDVEASVQSLSPCAEDSPQPSAMNELPSLSDALHRLEQSVDNQ